METNKLKHSIKSVEGGGFMAMVLACIGLLYTIFLKDKMAGPELNELLNMATSVADITEAYKGQVNWIAETVGLGETGAVLVFMYKLFQKFSSDRSSLKKTALIGEQNAR